MTRTMTPGYAKEVERRKRNAWRSAAERHVAEMRAARSALSLERRRKLATPPKPGSFPTEEQFTATIESWWNEHASLTFMPQPPPPAIAKSEPSTPRPKRKISNLMREVILLSEPICIYCHKARSTTLDHIFPHSRGGKDTYQNLVGSCTPCNTQKTDMTLEEAGLPAPVSDRLSMPDAKPWWFNQLPLISFKAECDEVSPLSLIHGFRVSKDSGGLIFEAISVLVPLNDEMANCKASELHTVLSPSDITVVARMRGRKVRLANPQVPDATKKLEHHRKQLRAVRKAFPNLAGGFPLAKMTEWAPAPEPGE